MKNTCMAASEMLGHSARLIQCLRPADGLLGSMDGVELLTRTGSQAGHRPAAGY